VTDLVLLVVLPAEGWLLLWLGSPVRAATFHRAADSPLTGPAAEVVLPPPASDQGV
jgi:hypothetical protein